MAWSVGAGYNRPMPSQRLFFPLLLVVVGLMAACGQAAASPTSGLGSQAPAGTARAVPSPEPTHEVAAASLEAPCVNDAVFLSDLTIPDGTVVQAGQVLDKRWSVRNSGTCDWGAGYRLVPVSPNPLAGETPLALYPAKAGADAVWQVFVHAPSQPGEIIGRWQAQTPDGTTFGQQVFIKIQVADITATPPASTPSPGP